tara:strand:+ start:279 stop:1385 length:1107 start_codon:yes stop_codon:yes gene_type:complete
MSTKKKILIIAGEESGDMYAADIIKNLSKANDIEFFGMGSHKMKKTKTHMIIDSSDLAVVGFFEIIKIYPKLKNALNLIKKSISQIKPDLIVLIDYQEFNLKVAKYAKSHGFKVLFYISPQVWAWRESRIKNIKNYIDTMAVIFPFEKSYYKKYSVEAVYVGHPLIESGLYKKNNFIGDSFIGFFPGSRINEINKHAPIIKKTIKKIQKLYPDEKFLVSKSKNIDFSVYKAYFGDEKNIEIVERDNIYETISMCKVALAASGTITLQLALMKIPMCVFYKISFLTYLIAKLLVKTNFISLANIVMGKKIVNEFIQNQANEKNLSDEIIKLIEDENYRESMIQNFIFLEKKLKDEPSRISIDNLIYKML